ncbi:MAG: type II toxin-antitoxin system HicB family antitoxin [Chloroflexi bacterium]|nr:type II toxin-antitoxin system HicB family antitoxin [Chloroflexota bacterium]
MKYAVILTRDDEGNWLASAPAFPGCHTWGPTREEALANAQEAVEGCIESLRASGDAVPREAAPPEIEFVQAGV